MKFNIADEEQEKELKRLRGLLNIRNSAEELRKPLPFVKRRRFIFEDIELDPDRDVLPAWKSTTYDHVKQFYREGNQIDAGDGLGISAQTDTVYKVRSLRHPTLGEVREVTALDYWYMRIQQGTGERVEQPAFEPVSDACPVRPPIFPKGFPSGTDSWNSPSYSGCAQEIRVHVGQRLKKAPEALTFDEILRFYQQKANPKANIFKV